MDNSQLIRVIEVVKKLRDPNNGCPWDLKQTHQSLLKWLVEESYEYIHAVSLKDNKKMEEELGDVLLQVLLHAQIASESGDFNLESVSKVLADKMIYRHPHVFEESENSNLTPEQVTKKWDELKKKKAKKKKFHITDEDAYAPALLAAHKIGAKSQEINFDWDCIEDVMKKVDEELLEVKHEMKTKECSQKLREEIGDLLFSVAQLSRHLEINPEEALKEANLKFIKRVNLVEKKVKDDQREMTQVSTEELELYWAKVKKELKK